MDDVNGTLAGLKSELSRSCQVKSSDDLHVGDIVYVELDKNDGLVLQHRIRHNDAAVPDTFHIKSPLPA